MLIDTAILTPNVLPEVTAMYATPRVARTARPPRVARTKGLSLAQRMYVVYAVVW